MIITLDSFEIANGVDRTAQVLASHGWRLSQQTQTAERGRDAWLTGFPSRAMRSASLVYQVTYPPCASLEAAFEQSRMVPVLCPKGGELVEQFGLQQVTWENAWIDGEITSEPMGVTNVFTFPIRAVNPSITELSPLAALNPMYVANLHSITTLTGGDNPLSAQLTVDVGVGFTAFLMVAIGGVVQPKHMRLITGATATNTDPEAGPLVVRPADFHADNNPKIWVE